MNEPSFQKTGFDTRGQYSDFTKDLLSAVYHASLQRNLPMKYIALNELFTHVRSYVEPVDRKEIDELFRLARGKVNSLGSISNSVMSGALRNEVDLLLININNRIHEAAKGFFMPLSGTEIDEVDWEKLKRS